MTDFSENSNYSLVTLVIPQPRLPHCLEQVLSSWPYKALQFDCRGTMVREHWFQAFLPIMNPELEYLQYVVKDGDVSAFMQFCVEVNDLHLPGSGAIFCSKFTHFSSNSESILAREVDKKAVLTDEVNNSQVQFKSNLYAIYALLQSGRTEQAIKAAIQAGSHGPLVYFVEGRGTRDRAGWLKITKKPYEEVVMVLAEDIDRESVVEALATAGRVGSLGSGVVFDMQIASGLINLPTLIGKKNQRSSNEQITAAIDQLMGNSDWRDRSSLNSLIDKTQANNNDSAAQHKSVLLSALIPRKYANDFLDQILIIGIPGANVIYAKLFSEDDANNAKGVQIHHELAQIRMVVSEERCFQYRMELQYFAADQGYEDVIIYEQDLDEVVRYQIKSKERDKTSVYRGARIN